MRKALYFFLWVLTAAVILLTGNSLSVASRAFTASQYLSITGSSVNLVGGTTISVAAWVKWTSIPSSGYPTILGKTHNAGNQQIQYSLDGTNTSGTFVFCVAETGSTEACAGCSSSVISNIWYNVVGTATGSTVNIYQNGINCGSSSQSGSFPSVDEPLCINGNNYLGSTNCTQNKTTIDVAEVAIWNVALTPNEIKSLASCSPPPAVHGGPSLVGYWPLWGIDSPEPDYSGKGSSAAVTGATKANHVCGSWER